MTPPSPHGVPRSERILRNAFRILGAPGEASWAAIGQAAARERPSPWDLAFLGPVSRTPAERGLALNRLVDPTQRLRERLFWFHEALAEEAVRDLTPANLRNAMEGWGAAADATAVHDAAVVGLITALVTDPGIDDVKLWTRVIEQWRDVLNAEEYWVAVIRVESEGGFEIPAPFGEIYEVREKSLGLLLEIPSGIARTAVLEEDLPRARRAIAALRTALPEDLFVPLVGDLAERLAEAAPSLPSPDGGLIPLAGRPRARSTNVQPPLAGEPPTVERSRVVPARSRAVPAPAAPAAPVAGIPDTPPPGRAPSAGEDGEPRPRPLPERVTPWPEPIPAPSRPVLPRPALAAGIVLALALAGFLAVRFVGSGRVDPLALRAGDPALVALDQRLVAHDAELAEVLLARRALDEELGRLHGDVLDYRALASDYQRRIAFRLNVDRRDYARVVQLHNAAVARYNARLSDRVALEDRHGEILDRGRQLVTRYNQQVN